MSAAEPLRPAQPRLQPRLYEAAVEALGRHLAEQGYHFVTPTPLTHQRNLDLRPGLATNLRGAFGWNRSFTADLLPVELFEQLRAAAVIAERSPGQWRSTLRCSSLGALRLFHSAYPTDAADAVFFGPDTYRFARCIQAHLVQRPVAPKTAVDIGCGSGAGGLVVATACPQAKVWGTDINDNALALSKLNAKLAGAANLQPRFSNVLRELEGQFDLIVANPPYMQDPQGRAYRDGGSGMGSGLSLRILSEALERLAPGGTLLLYTGVAIVDGKDVFLEGDRTLEGARTRLEGFAGQWRYQELDPDVFGEDLDQPGYAGAERIAVVLLEATRQG